ncbi:MAG TPA: hypothetical protein VGC38_08750 [Pseudolabrys sp.]
MAFQISRNFVGVVCLGLVLCGAAVAASPGAPQTDKPLSPAFLAQMRAMQARLNAMPDTPGTGPYPAIKEQVASLPDHVVYRPADLAKVGPGKLGILVWGNGGCSGDGASARLHLLQIASHGYLAIAPGDIENGPGAPPPPPPAKADGPAGLWPTTTTARQVAEGIDWAIAQNSRADSPLKGKIDTTEVAVSGWSCGGLQALTIATTDPRVRAVIIHNSGIFFGPTGMKEMDIGKATLDRLRTPVLYILGGASDPAYDHAMDDFQRITKVPVMVANLGDVGHVGTFAEPDGGKAALVDVAWLDWQLKGDADAARWFTGTACRLCTDPNWKVEKKGL